MADRRDLTPDAIQLSAEHARAVDDAIEQVRRRLAQGYRSSALPPGLHNGVTAAFEDAGWIVVQTKSDVLLFGLAADECARVGLARMLA